MTDNDGWKAPPTTPPGQWGALVAWQRKIEAALRALQGGAPLRSASISEGDLTIKNGGNVVVQDGGNVVVQDGGDVIVHEGGSFRADYADGTSGAVFGPLWLDSDPDVTESIGLLVQADTSDDNRDVFRAKKVLSSGSKEVYVGQADNNGNVDFVGVYSDSTVIHGDNGTWIESSGDGQIFIEAGGDLFLGGNEVAAKIPNITGTANLAIGGDPTSYGVLRRVGSSRRYKVDVESLDLSHLTADQIVDALQGSTWRDRGMVEQDPETTLRIPGHIAEDLHNAGLGAFVVYDDQDRPDSISYDRLSGALAQALRTTRDEAAQLRATVTAQGEAIATLTERLDALEA